MGVLKLNDGDVWRHIGCGHGVFTDNFTRPNGPIGAPWSEHKAGGAGGVIVNGNRAAPGSFGALQQHLAVVNVGSVDMDVQATIAAAPNLNDQGITYRHNNTAVFPAGHGSVAYDPAGFIAHYRPDTTFDYFPATVGDVTRVVCRGAEVKLYLNATLLETTTQPLPDEDQTWAGVYFEFQNNLGRIDDFSATAIGRLKLWDGTQWVRERGDTDLGTARPLKQWDGTSWVTVACMVPA